MVFVVEVRAGVYWRRAFNINGEPGWWIRHRRFQHKRPSCIGRLRVYRDQAHRLHRDWIPVLAMAQRMSDARVAPDTLIPLAIVTILLQAVAASLYSVACKHLAAGA